ncbi:MAG: nicotinate (nicotinamide) nucleotide adenylyltransferase [Ezakiella sp.]|nr:nicotinate (nicotinamide) nucleotide adenylyltransferase [Ezakiella sp.]
MATTLLYGGSFNPPTIAHVMTLKYAKDHIKNDRLIVFPTAYPPHKDKSKLDDDLRFEIAKKTFEEMGAAVSDIEFRLGGESFTYRTLEYFKEQYEDISLLMGMDSFLSLPKWKNADMVVELAKIIVLRRGGYELSEHELYLKNKSRFIFLDNPIFELSSTFVRQELASGRDIRYYVTDTTYELLKGRENYV